jgi:hypothetical protein
MTAQHLGGCAAARDHLASDSARRRTRAALVYFARAPLPGRTKTRLIPRLGADGAAELYRRFLLDAFARDCEGRADVKIAVAQEDHADPLRALAEGVCPGAELLLQSGRDLGARMAHTFAEVLGAGYAGAVILGTDAPSLPGDRVAKALALCEYRDLVLGPALDGGYYLIGLRKVIPEFLQDIAWGSPEVLVETLRRAQAINARVSLLEPWYDVDRPEDLALLRSHLTALHLAGEPIPCPRTWEFLQQLPPLPVPQVA